MNKASDAPAFQRTIASAGLIGPEKMATGDVDGDGDEDVVAFAQAKDELVWYENQSSGFGEKRVIATGSGGVEALAVADLNNTGRADLLAFTSGALIYYESNAGTDGSGADGFGDKTTVDSEVFYDYVTVAQLNGTKGPEIIVGNEVGEGGYYPNQIGTSSADSDGFADLVKLDRDLRYAADFDGDGDKDLANGREWIPNQIGEDGADADGFGSPRRFTRSFEFRSVLGAGDLDGDADADVVGLVETTEGPVVAWLENQIGESGAGEDEFGAPQQISDSGLGDIDIERIEVRLGPIDGDEDLDLLLGRSDFSGGTIAWHENRIGESGADSDGFGEATPITTQLGGQDVALAQIDGVAGEDVLLTFSTSSRLSFFPADVSAQNGFGDEQPISVPSEVPLAQDVVTADFDGDGDPDAATAAAGSGQVAWHENKIGESGGGSDGFGPPQVVSTAEDSAMSLFAADFDGDNDLDLVSASGTNSRIAWHENQIGESGADADGFADPQVITTDVTAARDVLVSDIDGDGDPDVVTGAENSPTVAWHENQIGEDAADRDGFSPQRVIATTSGEVTELSSADLDGDGAPDVLVSTDDGLFWYSNQVGTPGSDGDGFGGALAFGDNSTPSVSIFAADLDEDGANDVLTEGKWYRNRQDGPFPSDDSFGDGVRIYSENAQGQENIVASDLDGDGDRDPVFVGYSSLGWIQNTIAEGSALGNRNPSQIITSGLVNGESVTASDLNGDGAPDLLAVGSQGGQFIWLENQSEPEPVASSTTTKMVSGAGSSAYGTTGATVSAQGVGGSGQVTVRRFESAPKNPEGIPEPNVGQYRHVIENTGSLTLGGGTQVRFDTSALSGIDRPENVTVYGRPGPGAGNFRALPTSFDADTGELVVPSSSLGEFAFGSATEPLFPYPDRLVTEANRTFDGANKPGDYRLVALPGQIDAPLAQTLDGSAGTDWQAFRENGEAFEKYDGSEAFNFRPGNGFWVTGTQAWTVNDTLATVSLSGQRTVSVDLNGDSLWTIVSNPLNRDVAWSNVLEESGLEKAPLWQFDAEEGFVQADTMQSAATGTAYYVFNGAGADSLTVPFPDARGKKQVAKKQEQDSLLSVSARPVEGGVPSTVRLGIGERMSLIAPPGQFEPVSLRLRPEPSERALMVARRPAGEEEGQAFKLRLTPRTEGAIRLRAADLQAVEGQSVALLHPSAGQSYDLRAMESVTIEPGEKTTTLRVVVGTESFVEGRAEDILPDEMSLTSYPNPVRRQGTLEYRLTEPQEVSLEVYDVLGRKVKTLARGRKDAGRHRVELQTNQLSSGVYFGRLKAGGKTRTQKITVVR